MQSKERRECFMDSCKNRLWAKNPLFAVACGHHVCRECILEIQSKQYEKRNSVPYKCGKCNEEDEFDFKSHDENYNISA